jgi:hypothetical protein
LGLYGTAVGGLLGMFVVGGVGFKIGEWAAAIEGEVGVRFAFAEFLVVFFD